MSERLDLEWAVVTVTGDGIEYLPQESERAAKRLASTRLATLPVCRELGDAQWHDPKYVRQRVFA